MKSIKKIFFCVLFFAVILLTVFYLWLSGHYVVPIATYHNVGDVPSHNALWVSPSNFEYQMAYLKRNRYRVIPLSELVDGIEKRRNFSKKDIVITFDDGYENNYTQAYPILKKYGFPATIFLVSDWIGKPGYLNVDQIQEMAKHGISFGSHTRTHPFLPHVEEGRKREEIAGSKEILEKTLGMKVEHLAYPFGGFTQKGSSKIIAREAGYKAALTTSRELDYDRFNRDPYALKRIRFSDQDTKYYTLWMKFLGYYNLFRKQKQIEQVDEL